MRHRIGRYHDALADLAAARPRAPRGRRAAPRSRSCSTRRRCSTGCASTRAPRSGSSEAGALAPRSPRRCSRRGSCSGLGRSLHRFSRHEEAAWLLEDAARRRTTLGDDGYETLVIALMLGFVYPGLGQLDDAKRALDRTIALAEAHGDRLHLAGAINHRAMLRAILGDTRR